MSRARAKRDPAAAAATPARADASAPAAPAAATPAAAAADRDHSSSDSASGSGAGGVSPRWTTVLIGLAFACGVVATLMGHAALTGASAPAMIIRVQSAPTPATAQASSFAADPAVVNKYLTPALERVSARGADMELESDAVTSRGGRMIMAWQTPVYRVNIAAFGRVDDAVKRNKRVFDVTAFNSAIASRVLTYFRAVTEQTAQQRAAAKADADASTAKGDAAAEKLVFDASDAQNANQIFYEWQVSGGADVLFNHSESRQMFVVAQMAVDIVLQTLGLSAEFISARDRSIGAWATVHYGCMAHMAHTHPDNLVSVVYYVRVPDDAGALVLYDPRGPRPPFDTRIRIRPRAGDIVVFPSWLSHNVNPTPGTDPRISIAFNVAGDWSTTSNIRNVFDVNVE